MDLAKSVLRERKLWIAGPFEVLHGYPREATCHVTPRTSVSPFFFLDRHDVNVLLDLGS